MSSLCVCGHSSSKHANGGKGLCWLCGCSTYRAHRAPMMIPAYRPRDVSMTWATKMLSGLPKIEPLPLPTSGEEYADRLLELAQELASESRMPIEAHPDEMDIEQLRARVRELEAEKTAMRQRVLNLERELAARALVESAITTTTLDDEEEKTDG